jgi:hypothetical protein
MRLLLLRQGPKNKEIATITGAMRTSSLLMPEKFNALHIPD